MGHAATASELETGVAFLDAARAQGAKCDGTMSWQGGNVRMIEGVERYSRAWKSGQSGYDQDWQWAYHMLNDGPWEMRRSCPSDLPNSGVAGWGGYGFNCPQGSMDVTQASLRSEAASYRKLAEVVACIEGRLPAVVAEIRRTAAPPPAPAPPVGAASPTPAAPAAPPPASQPDLATQLARDRAYAEAQGAAWLAVGQAWVDAAPQIAAMASDVPAMYGRPKLQMEIGFGLVGARFQGGTAMAFPTSVIGRYFGWFNHPPEYQEKRSNGLEVFLEARGTVIMGDGFDPLVTLGTRFFYRGLGIAPVLVGSPHMDGPAPGIGLAIGSSPAQRSYVFALEGQVAVADGEPYLQGALRVGATIFNMRVGYEIASRDDLFFMQFGTRFSSRDRSKKRVPRVEVPPALKSMDGNRVTIQGTTGNVASTGDRHLGPEWPDLPRSYRGEIWTVRQTDPSGATSGRENRCVLVPREVIAGQPIRSMGSRVVLSGTLESTKSRMCPMLLVVDRVD